MKRHFATTLSRLLNASQSGNAGSPPTGVVLAKMLSASSAPSVSEVNSLPIPTYHSSITFYMQVLSVKC
jgi:hypothetical protein